MITKGTIVWFLHCRDICPIGGFKVVYEYANRFAADGYEVFIVYPQFLKLSKHKNIFFNFLRWNVNLLRYFYNKIKKTDCNPNWFQLNLLVHCEYVFRFKNSKTMKIHGAKFIATAIATSFELSKIKQIESKNKFYFVQDFESWNGISSECVYDSYRLPLKKITIAPWLVERIESVGSSAVLVENGFDFEYFKMTNPIEKRSPYEVAMLYHLDDRKRCCDSIAALYKVKEKIPQLHVTMFGTPERPDVPNWFEYFQMPDRETHNNIYNKASIFVAASKAEGMALPPAEAMMCGCALVCTDIGGFSVYAKNDETALMSTVYDVDALAQNILRLVQDDGLRKRLARNGNEFIKQFTWERAFGKFKAVLEDKE